jgi:DNA-binding NtrC family response regulator
MEIISSPRDETLAVTRRVPVLISADRVERVRNMARAIHDRAHSAAAPFVELSAAMLPDEPSALTSMWMSITAGARGGSILLTDVESVPKTVQNAFAGLITYSRDRVRLIAGTTERLMPRVAAGTFSETLFYRLNVIHLVEGEHF